MRDISNYKREREQVGMEGSKKYLPERRKEEIVERVFVASEEVSEQHAFSLYKWEGVKSIAPGGLAQRTPHMRTCILCSTCVLPYAYVDQKWLRHCMCSNSLRKVFDTTNSCHSRLN